MSLGSRASRLACSAACLHGPSGAGTILPRHLSNPFRTRSWTFFSKVTDAVMVKLLAPSMTFPRSYLYMTIYSDMYGLVCIGCNSYHSVQYDSAHNSRRIDPITSQHSRKGALHGCTAASRAASRPKRHGKAPQRRKTLGQFVPQHERPVSLTRSLADSSPSMHVHMYYIHLCIPATTTHLLHVRKLQESKWNARALPSISRSHLPIAWPRSLSSSSIQPFRPDTPHQCCIMP